MGNLTLWIFDHTILYGANLQLKTILLRREVSCHSGENRSPRNAEQLLSNKLKISTESAGIGFQPSDAGLIKPDNHPWPASLTRIIIAAKVAVCWRKLLSPDLRCGDCHLVQNKA